MIAVALPSIGVSLHLSPASLQWIVNGYILGYAGFLLLGGRISDLISRRTVFLTAVTIFGVASVLSALVSVDAVLVGLRFIKGASAGFTVPAGLSILTTTFAEGPARNRALGIYTVCGASGFSLGLVCGGLLTGLGWRVTLLMPGPVALLIVFIGLRIIPRTPSVRVRLGDLDLVGAVTGTLALLFFVYSIVEAPQRGWASPANARRGGHQRRHDGRFYPSRAPSPNPASPFRHPALPAPCARRHLRRSHVRKLRRLSVPGHHLPAGFPRLVTADDGAGVPALWHYRGDMRSLEWRYPRAPSHDNSYCRADLPHSLFLTACSCGPARVWRTSISCSPP